MIRSVAKPPCAFRQRCAPTPARARTGMAPTMRPTTRHTSSMVAHASEEVAGPDYSAVQRNLALELVRVTEAAALASGRFLGKGDENAADQAAVDMMRRVLNSVQMDGIVVIGEGEKDDAPMLFCGEHIGDGSYMKTDIAVDPLDGTSLVASGMDGAISRGSLFDPGPCMYMEKLAVGNAIDPDSVSLDFPVAQNLESIAKQLGIPVTEVTVLVLDRPRHAQLIADIRAAGGRIRLIQDGDVGGAIEVAKRGSACGRHDGHWRNSRGGDRRCRFEVHGRKLARSIVAS
eukprot:gene30043-35017_t